LIVYLAGDSRGVITEVKILGLSKEMGTKHVKNLHIVIVYGSFKIK
jgi:hypothetical protein